MRTIAGALLVFIVAGCAGGGSPTAVSSAAPSVAVSAAPSVAPATTAVPTPAATATPTAPPAPTLPPAPTPTPRGCLPDPISLADLIGIDKPQGPLSAKYPQIAGPYGEHALACLGGASITFKGFVAVPEGLGGVTAFSYEPTWFFTGYWVQPTAAVMDPAFPEFGAGPWLAMAIPEEVGNCWGADGIADPKCPFQPYAGKWVMVTGHYDDPAAKDCRVVSKSPEVGPAPNAKQMVQICRSTFVLDTVAPAS